MGLLICHRRVSHRVAFRSILDHLFTIPSNDEHLSYHVINDSDGWYVVDCRHSRTLFLDRKNKQWCIMWDSINRYHDTLELPP
jgi:hypothetical protein